MAEFEVHYIDVASFIERLSDFVMEDLTHDAIVELLRYTDIEGESSDLAAHFPLI